MPKARVSGFLKKITVGSDCKMDITIFDPDEVLPDLLPMRATRIWMEIETAQPDIEDIRGMNDRDAGKVSPDSEEPEQLKLDFDQSGFQVPRLEVLPGQDHANPEAPADPGEAPEPSPFCPECGVILASEGAPCRNPDCSQYGVTPTDDADQPGPQGTADTGSPTRPCPLCEGKAGQDCPVCCGKGNLPVSHEGPGPVGDI